MIYYSVDTCSFLAFDFASTLHYTTDDWRSWWDMLKR